MLSAFPRRFLKISAIRCSTVNFNINRKLNIDSDKNIVYSPFPEIKPSNLPVPEFVFQDFGKYPNKIAVECAITGKKYTYEELRRTSENFGKALQKKFKLRKGDVVGLLLPNIPDFPVCLLGALQAALTVTTINPMYTPDEIKRQIIDSDTKILVTLGMLWPSVKATLKLLPGPNLPTIITIKMMEAEALPQETVNFHELVNDRYDTDIIGTLELDDLAVMPYSSGTTGIPKGVELSSRKLVSNLLQVDEPYIKFGEITTDMHQDVIPGIIPWFHIYGLVGILLNNLHILSKLVTLPKFTPETYIGMLEKHKPHILYIVPPLVMFMNNSPQVQKKHLDSIHTILSGAAPLGALDEEKLRKKADKPINILQGYGLTESCSCIFVMCPKTKNKFGGPGSVGEPVSSTVIKIAPLENLSGDALGPNQSGELLVKGPQMSTVYHNNVQESKDSYVDGWFRTGDVAYYDENNLFYITDRLKELIKVKGFQVAPAELEEVIRDFPGIAEVAVLGIPHEEYGEVPRAYIVPKPNTSLNSEELQKYVASKVSPFKQLKGGVIVLDSIPKTAAGKILKRELKVLYENSS